MAKSVREIIKLINELDPTTKHRLVSELSKSISSSLYDEEPINKEITERKNEKGFVCPHCKNTHVVRFGKYITRPGIREIERQRYKCKNCDKTFTDFTNTPLNRTHFPNKWIAFIECMVEGYSLRKSAELIGDISYVTLFYWRHKLLSAIKQMPIENFNGIVEMDETCFLYSEKGKRNITGRKSRKRGGSSKYRGISKEQVCVLIARDRQKTTLSSVLGKGRIVKEKLEKVVGDKLSDKNVLCTDAWRAFSTYAKEKDLEHHRFKSDGTVRVKKGIYHIQNVNNYHSRLKTWVRRFNGVATKYLENYLAWFRFLDMKGHERTREVKKDFLVSSCLFSVQETYDTLRLSQMKI
jgi:transposase-like protein/IS1 family transposase